jgi:oligopeptide transport system permease protein
MAMAKYSVKRLLQGLITVLLIATIVFLLMRLLPTDYYFTEEQLMKFTDQQKEDALRAAGLLDPLGKQLINFYNSLLHLDFGISRRIQTGTTVVKVIGNKFAISMKLGVIALCISLVLGIALGILQTIFKDRVMDHVGTAYTVFVNSVPSLVSYSLVLVIGTRVFNLPSMYSTRNNTGLSSVLPIVCLSLASIAGYALWTRRYMVDEINKDYIKLAKVKGLNTRQIMVSHVLRNAFVPLAQYLPASFLLTISGSLLVERFFSVPGLGPLLVDGITKYDLNVVQTLVILYASLGILGVFLGDILMMIIDPRISLTGKGGGR